MGLPAVEITRIMRHLDDRKLIILLVVACFLMYFALLMDSFLRCTP